MGRDHADDVGCEAILERAGGSAPPVYAFNRFDEVCAAKIVVRSLPTVITEIGCPWSAARAADHLLLQERLVHGRVGPHAPSARHGIWRNCFAAGPRHGSR